MRAVRAEASGSLHDPTSGRRAPTEAMFSPTLAASRTALLKGQEGVHVPAGGGMACPVSAACNHLFVSH